MSLSLAAKLPLHLDPRLRLHAHEHLGDCPDVSHTANDLMARPSESLMRFTWQMAHTGDSYRTCTFALINGGTAGLVWGYFIVWMGYLLVFATISEMASMYVLSIGALDVAVHVLIDVLSGPQPPVASITGYPSSLLRAHKDLLATSLVRKSPCSHSL